MNVHRTLLQVLAMAAVLLGGCMSVAEHRSRLESTTEREMTLGMVQRELHRGMAQGDVATALGSPNIVTRDSDGRETWIYDKVATEASYSGGGHYMTLALFGADGSSGASSSAQRTLTVVIKFDGASAVDSFAYHASRF